MLYPKYIINNFKKNVFFTNYPIMIDDNTFISFDPRQWSNLSLSNDIYKILIQPIGISCFNTNSKFYIKSININFILSNTSKNFDPYLEFVINSTINHIEIIQNKNIIFKINSLNSGPIIYFKYCKVFIYLII